MRPLVGVVGLALVALAACGGSGGDDATSGDDDVITLSEAMSTELEDQRPSLMQVLGEPQAFRIVFVPVEGAVMRHETWDYLELGSRFDFVDGQLVLTADIDPAPDGSWLPGHISPTDFEAGMSPDDVRTQLEGVELEDVDLAEVAGEGATAMVGGQLLVTFTDGELTSVETFLLEPDADGLFDATIEAVTP